MEGGNNSSGSHQPSGTPASNASKRLKTREQTVQPFVHTATPFVHTCVWPLFTHVCGSNDLLFSPDSASFSPSFSLPFSLPPSPAPLVHSFTRSLAHTCPLPPQTETYQEKVVTSTETWDFEYNDVRVVGPVFNVNHFKNSPSWNRWISVVSYRFFPEIGDPETQRALDAEKARMYAVMRARDSHASSSWSKLNQYENFTIYPHRPGMSREEEEVSVRRTATMIGRFGVAMCTFGLAFHFLCFMGFVVHNPVLRYASEASVCIWRGNPGSLRSEHIRFRAQSSEHIGFRAQHELILPLRRYPVAAHIYSLIYSYPLAHARFARRYAKEFSVNTFSNKQVPVINEAGKLRGAGFFGWQPAYQEPEYEVPMAMAQINMGPVAFCGGCGALNSSLGNTCEACGLSLVSGVVNAEVMLQG